MADDGDDARHLTETCKALLKQTREFIKRIEEIDQDVGSWDEETLTSLKKGKNGEILVSKILKKIQSNLLTASKKTENFQQSMADKIHKANEESEQKKKQSEKDEQSYLDDEQMANEEFLPNGLVQNGTDTVEWSETLQKNGIQQEILSQSGTTSPTLSHASSFDFGHSYHPQSGQGEIYTNPTPSVGTISETALSTISIEDFAMDVENQQDRKRLETDDMKNRLKQEHLPKLSIPVYNNVSPNPKSALPTVGMKSSKSSTNLNDLDDFFGENKTSKKSQPEKPKSLTTPKSSDHVSTFKSGDPDVSRDEWDEFLDTAVSSTHKKGPESDTQSVSSDQSSSLLVDISHSHEDMDHESPSDQAVSPSSSIASNKSPQVISPNHHRAPSSSSSNNYNLDDFMSEPTLEDMLSTDNLNSKSTKKTPTNHAQPHANFSALDEYLGQTRSSGKPRDLLQFASKQEEFCDNVLSLFHK